MNVSLTPQLETWIQQQVDGGQYQSASEVVREAVRLFQRYQTVEDQKLSKLRSEIMKGIDSAKRGELSDVTPALFESIKKKGRER